MFNVLLVVHILLAAALIGSVLLQRSEGGGLGIGGSSGAGMAGFMTGRSTANLLTRTTAVLAAGFMLTSIVLVLMSTTRSTGGSILDRAAPTQPAPAPAVPSVPAVPSAPQR
jgi:preprotein translocase subunit SecG